MASSLWGPWRLLLPLLEAAPVADEVEALFAVAALSGGGLGWLG